MPAQGKHFPHRNSNRYQQTKQNNQNKLKNHDSSHLLQVHIS